MDGRKRKNKNIPNESELEVTDLSEVNRYAAWDNKTKTDQFLKEIAEEIFKPGWDKKGKGLFGSKTPLTVERIRTVINNYNGNIPGDAKTSEMINQNPKERRALAREVYTSIKKFLIEALEKKPGITGRNSEVKKMYEKLLKKMSLFDESWDAERYNREQFLKGEKGQAGGGRKPRI